MSAEHRRQLLAYFIVALAAFLLIGHGLHNQFRPSSGQPRNPAAIAAGPTTGPAPARSSVEVGGSARGTTGVDPARSPLTAVTKTSVTAPPPRAASGHTDQARTADRGDQRFPSSAQKQATTHSARIGATYQAAGRATTAAPGSKAQAKKHAKKHGKKDGRKAHRHDRHGR